MQITGSPATSSARNSDLVHHMLLDGDFEHFYRAYLEVVTAGEILTRQDAGCQIDHVLTVALDRMQPGYLAVPADLTDARVDAAPLTRPLTPSPSDSASLREHEPAAGEDRATERWLRVELRAERLD